MKWLKFLLVLFLAVVLGGAALALDGKKAKVTSEPLSCFEMGQQAVCFDGTPSGNLSCERLDDNLVICTTKQPGE